MSGNVRLKRSGLACSLPHSTRPAAESASSSEARSLARASTGLPWPSAIPALSRSTSASRASALPRSWTAIASWRWDSRISSPRTKATAARPRMTARSAPRTRHVRLRAFFFPASRK
ncbi:MAG TPA: hypothetical protein P5076_12790, partial [Myxococcota bacterium]|nr:hypothetical protein [Myxococcota bacterium]